MHKHKVDLNDGQNASEVIQPLRKYTLHSISSLQLLAKPTQYTDACFDYKSRIYNFNAGHTSFIPKRRHSKGQSQLKSSSEALRNKQ